GCSAGSYEGGIMAKQLYFVGANLDRPRQVVTQIEEIPSDTQRVSQPKSAQSEELRNAVNGSIAGAAIGLVYGIATLMVIGAAFIPGVLGAALILGYAALGGVMFGAIIGSTGLFARTK